MGGAVRKGERRSRREERRRKSTATRRQAVEDSKEAEENRKEKEREEKANSCAMHGTTTREAVQDYQLEWNAKHPRREITGVRNASHLDILLSNALRRSNEVDRNHVDEKPGEKEGGSAGRRFKQSR